MDTHTWWTVLSTPDSLVNTWLMRTLWHVPLVFVLTEVPFYLFLILRKGHLKDFDELCFHNYM